MIINIGCVINELVKYTRNLEVSLCDGIPVVIGRLATISGPTRVNLHIAQTGNGKFYACTDYYDPTGSRLIPTGNRQKPFIREIDQIRALCGSSGESAILDQIENASYGEVIDYIVSLLTEFRLIVPSSDTLGQKVASFGFTNPKISRVLNTGFVANGKRSGTVEDLFDIIIKRRAKFSLTGLRAKDIKCLQDRLNNRGILLSVNNDRIEDITFKRR